MCNGVEADVDDGNRSSTHQTLIGGGDMNNL